MGGGNLPADLQHLIEILPHDDYGIISTANNLIKGYLYFSPEEIEGMFLCVEGPQFVPSYKYDHCGQFGNTVHIGDWWLLQSGEMYVITNHPNAAYLMGWETRTDPYNDPAALTIPDGVIMFGFYSRAYVADVLSGQP